MRQPIDLIDLEHDARRAARVGTCSASESRRHRSDAAPRLNACAFAVMSESSLQIDANTGLGNFAYAMTRESTVDDTRCGVADTSERPS